jgi:UDP-N-acetylmuramate dehydrogenase
MLSEIVQWRRENQPGGQNAGSVFVNPEGETSGELLDRLGLKGFRIGSAQVSSKHANFVQADPGGSAADVDAVITAVAERVQSETGIVLRTEIQRIGFEG